MIFEIVIKARESFYVKGRTKGIAMLPFDGEVTGPYFTGQVIGPGVDTQTIKDEQVVLSARYMLEGVDCEGNSCRVFVENNGDFVNGFTPFIVTDSPVLQKFEDKKLRSTVEPREDVVIIKIMEAKT